jgi:RNA polymerase sigma-70 factor (ECF subfamily)
MTPSDKTLVENALAGDPSAVEELVRRHLKAACSIATAVLGSAADGEDLAQDAFVVALDRLHSCRDGARFRPWLCRIVRNRALNALSTRRPRDEAGPELVHEADAARQAERVFLRRRLEQALLLLTPAQREVVVLHDLEGWTHAEIADCLELSEVNCRQHLFTARKLLKAKLEEAAHG